MLSGCTVLVVEEEFLIALDIQRVLESLHAEQTLFARHSVEAQAMPAGWPGINLAIIELRADCPAGFELAQQLAAAAIPMIITTSDPGLHTAIAGPIQPQILLKPIPDIELASAIQQALAIPSDQAQPAV